MSQKDNIPTNEVIVDDITSKLEAECCVSGENEKLGATAEDVAKAERDSQIPKNFEDSDAESDKEEHDDDYVDEVAMKDLESTLSDKDKELKYQEAVKLKAQGNEEFKAEKYLESIATYTKALRICPLKYPNDRSIFYANRAAAKTKLDRKKSAIDDCTKAIELNELYVKAYMRRAKLYEDTEKLDESLADYKKILELDPANREAREAQYRLPPLIAERNEKMKEEMLGKLKSLGDMILKPFGLSTQNFEMNQDPNSGGYSINFKQNPN
ncbi:unnamed protein product [Callosobruchus maculatus]|uniref:Tetratricopeptide repeat protein 1 n=1 Tax=Callosobruchus maculatus TaxID=64391 RepID=A0A653DG19_CALMS|nr:unnamed protein product [Callosobruchus maculatus]